MSHGAETRKDRGGGANCTRCTSMDAALPNKGDPVRSARELRAMLTLA